MAHCLVAGSIYIAQQGAVVHAALLLERLPAGHHGWQVSAVLPFHAALYCFQQFKAAERAVPHDLVLTSCDGYARAV